MMTRIWTALALGGLMGQTAFADIPPSRFGVDAPELAPLGERSVGVRTFELVEAGQVDPLSRARAE